jgi:RHS repeat-associated protein
MYLPFGGTRWESGSTPTDFQFTGQRKEAGFGLYDYNARYYDPLLGRFVSADSIVPGAGKPQALNRYSYVFNNPLKYTDPTGHAARMLDDEEDLRDSAGDPDNCQGKKGCGSSGAGGSGGGVQSDPAFRQKMSDALAEQDKFYANYQKSVNQVNAQANSGTSNPGSGNTVSVYHGSINDASSIRANGFDPKRGAPYVSTDVRAAQDAIGPNRLEISNGLAKDPGIIKSQIPRAEFEQVMKPLERPYTGFYPNNLNSTEIILRTPESIELFNLYIVK